MEYNEKVFILDCIESRAKLLRENGDNDGFLQAQQTAQNLSDEFKLGYTIEY
jgi:hypothetical protein